ncbi:hypothetical protein EI427_23920 [Flammeovirga pectinis]|uniref:Porin n=1 Tax=Flammeovirga pectinis TaxID=2494373 RepID=A0A3S9PAJ4_9BACT|nr:porin [Flammeovirga pectinis]AZQ65265.1 hypothetical protein EI427_23920 [Flammeovirga pectinis]
MNLKNTVFFSLLIIGLTTTSIFAQNKKRGWEFFKENLEIPINGRMDYRFLNYDENFDDFTKDSRFQFSTFLFKVNGKLTDQMSFNYRQVFNNNSIGTANISDNIQVASLSLNSKNKKWTFTGGKFFLNLGSVEQEYDPSDVYRYSVLNNNLACWKTGIGFLYSSESGQDIGIQMVNGALDSLGNQVALQYNAYWNGTLLKDKIDIYANATTLTHYKDYDSQAFSSAIGLQWFFNDFIIDTDVIVARNMPNLYKNAGYLSSPIKIQYMGNKFRPYIKFIYDAVKFDNENDRPSVVDPEDGSIITVNNTEMLTGEIALEYYPWDHHNIRFHLVASYANHANYNFTDELNPEYDPNSRHHYVSQYQILLGCRFGFNMLDPLNK